MKKRLLALFIAITTLLVPISALSAETGAEEANILNAILQLLENNYRYDIDNKEILKDVMETALKKDPSLFEAFADAIIENMDEHTQYYTKEEFEQFFSSVEKAYAGIGAYISRIDKYCIIAGFLPDSPAQKAGLMENDKIISVNGENVEKCDRDEVVSKIRGDENTTVSITVLRDDKYFTYSVTRQILHELTVNYGQLENNIGYIEITNFSSATSNEFKDALRDLKNRGISRFIIDLRNNPGGVTQQALLSAGQLIPYNATMIRISAKGQEDLVVTNDVKGEKVKLAVLINENTASAAELFSAAIKDNKAGVIIGTKSYGKGSMQNTVGLGKFGGIKYTTAEFLSPDGNKINKVGINPDILVQNITREATIADFEPLTYTEKFYLGDSSEQIYAIKQRLSALKFFSGTMDNYFDETLDLAVKQFQSCTNLCPCGDLDFTTQTFINNLALEAIITEDTQLKSAHKYLTELK